MTFEKRFFRQKNQHITVKKENTTEDRIMNLLKNEEKITISNLAKNSELSIENTDKIVLKLKKQDFIKTWKDNDYRFSPTYVKISEIGLQQANLKKTPLVPQKEEDYKQHSTLGKHEEFISPKYSIHPPNNNQKLPEILIAKKYEIDVLKKEINAKNSQLHEIENQLRKIIELIS
jgi:predicted transcriptional regulator